MDRKQKKFDALKEIAHIGAGNASESLSQLTDKNIGVEFPEIEEHKIDEVPEILGDKEQMMTATSIRVLDKLEKNEAEELGRIALLMDFEDSKKLSKFLSGEETGERLNEEEISALKEMENILAGSCLEAVSEIVGERYYEGTPFFHVDLLGALMQALILDMIETHDELLIFKTQFHFEEEVDAYFIFFFTEKGYERILESIE